MYKKNENPVININGIRKLSIVYLIIPNFIFLYSWFKLFVSIPAIFIILYLLYKELSNKEKYDSESFINIFDVLFLVLVAIVLTFLSGVSGYSYQVWDWWGHNAKFYDLYLSEWPYYFLDVNRLVRYYFGYYLFPVLLFDLFDGIYPTIIFFWTAFGFFLGISFLYMLLFKNRLLLILSLFFAGCGSFLVAIAFQLNIDVPGPIYNLVFTSIYDMLIWAPNQIIPVVIAICIVFYDNIIRKDHYKSFFAISLTLIWAIFPFVSLCIIYAILFFYNEHYKELMKKSLIFEYILVVIFLAPLLVYFASGDKPSISGFIWSFPNENTPFIRYLSGFFLDTVIIYFVIRALHRFEDIPKVGLLNSLFLAFICLSIYRIGEWNDWFSKMNLPFFVFFNIVFLRFVYLRVVDGVAFKAKSLSKLILLYFFMNLIQQVNVIKRPLIFNEINRLLGGSGNKPIPYDRYENLYQAMIELYGKEGAKQYMAKKDSFYERYLAKVN